MILKTGLCGLLVGALLCTGVALAQPTPLNVLQDCWTAPGDFFEEEIYTFDELRPPIFVWKHKLLEPCERYVARIVGFPCRDGKPAPRTDDIRFDFAPEFGFIEPDPDFPERLFGFFAPPIPPGRYDWILLVECNDAGGNGIPIGPDGDIDDECGINVGFAPTPLIFGPEPNEAFDPAPGGVPPGRGRGEEGTTRPWCFDVVPPQQ